MIISLIVALDKNRLIGKNGQLPWHLPEDLKQFKVRTWGHPIIMGRKTWDSLPKKPLPGRLNIVVSKTVMNAQVFDMEEASQMVYFRSDLKSAIALATTYCPNNDEIFIIGGKQVYETALNEKVVDKMYVTEVHGDHEGDTYFPLIPIEFGTPKEFPGEAFTVWEHTKA